MALVDMHRVGEGTIGYTTAKLTVGHGLIYADLLKKHGEETARAYAASNQWAIERLGELVSSEEIDCDWEHARITSTRRTRTTERSTRRGRGRATRGSLGGADDRDRSPVSSSGAVRIDAQAQFHPQKFLQGLAAKVVGDGSHVFEQTRVTDVRTRDDCVVSADQSELRGRHVVLATHLPFLDRGLFFAKAHPQKSYAIAAQIARSQAPSGMYISAERPTRSVRSTPEPNGSRFLIIGGEGHKPGRDERHTRRRYKTLETFLDDRFGRAERSSIAGQRTTSYRSTNCPTSADSAVVMSGYSSQQVSRSGGSPKVSSRQPS